MLFNSVHYIIFFILTTILYFLIPHKYRNVLLLIMSYYFYMCWNPVFIILIVFSTFINYVSASKIYRAENDKKKKNILKISLFINFGLLFIFKYLMFISDTFKYLFEYFGLTYPVKDFSILLPMGISFFTFQAVGYVIDVYYNKIKPIKSYFIFSLYITFFPQLVAGPIERSKNLIPQFFEKHKFDLDRAVYGVKIMLFGFFKKVVIADRVAVLVNTVYNSPNNFSGMYYIVATLLFAFQIYCDFSGYSDIAIGSANVLGFDLMKNFKNPYLSKSIKEFWRKWHISLSTWFMDYVYIPLGGSRCSKFKNYRNLIITFLVSGLWHGANWTFVLWGFIHGVFLVIGRITGKARASIKKALHLENKFGNLLSMAVTFILVCLTWVFFRANTISDVFYIFSHLFDNASMWFTRQYAYELLTTTGLNLMEIKIIVLALIFLVLSECFSGEEQVYDCIERRNIAVRFLFYIILATFIIGAGVFYNAGEFIYFQF